MALIGIRNPMHDHIRLHGDGPLEAADQPIIQYLGERTVPGYERFSFVIESYENKLTYQNVIDVTLGMQTIFQTTSNDHLTQAEIVVDGQGAIGRFNTEHIGPASLTGANSSNGTALKINTESINEKGTTVLTVS